MKRRRSITGKASALRTPTLAVVAAIFWGLVERRRWRLGMKRRRNCEGKSVLFGSDFVLY